MPSILFLPLDLGDLDKVANFEDHPADCRIVLLHHRPLVPQTQRLERRTLIVWRADSARIASASVSPSRS